MNGMTGCWWQWKIMMDFTRVSQLIFYENFHFLPWILSKLTKTNTHLVFSDVSWDVLLGRISGKNF